MKLTIRINHYKKMLFKLTMFPLIILMYIFLTGNVLIMIHFTINNY